MKSLFAITLVVVALSTATLSILAAQPARCDESKLALEGKAGLRQYSPKNTQLWDFDTQLFVESKDAPSLSKGATTQRPLPASKTLINH